MNPAGQLSRQAVPRIPSLARWLIVFAAIVVLARFDARVMFAQGVYAAPVPVTAEQLQKMQAAQARTHKQPSQPQSKPTEKKPDKKKDDKKNGDKKKEDGVKTIKRPTDKPASLDPNRVKLQPDADGRVQFNYQGHPWVEVLQDYADAANLSFDWQELPADFLNLTTQRKYRLDEARDLLNRHLLARGFTLILQGELLTAVKINKLDPSLVPRVSPDDLEDYPPYDFVRVRFELPLSMDPAKAKDDVKVLLSPNAKVTPLLATRRLLVIDAVANLRSVRDLLYAEQLAASSEIKPVVYQLRFRRADYVADQIMIVLGLDPGARKSPKELQLETQKMQLFMQMQQKGKDVSKLLKKDGPAVHIVVNRRQNSLLVNAPPELLPIIDRTVEQLDVRDGPGAELDSGQLTMKKYNTVTIGTDAIVTALDEIGRLDPRTQIQSDKESKTIFASATAVDHVKIQEMIERLDGTGRSSEVIWLPARLPADAVAGSIMAIIVGPEKKKEKSRRPWYFWDYGNNDDEEKNNDGFRIFPDVANNRLLLWANQDELQEVKDLIAKLSKQFGSGHDGNRRVRRYEARDPEATRRLLEQLRSTWHGKNQLDIQMPPQPEQPEAGQSSPEESDNKKVKKDTVTRRGDQLRRFADRPTWLAQVVAPTDDASHPVIRITVNDAGEIVIASDDTEALAQLEELMTELAPPQVEFETFKLRYIRASTVVMNLEIYFEDDLAEKADVFETWFMRRETQPQKTAATLGKRPPLRFIDDSVTNTVIVSNASASQMRTICDLIDVYDSPPIAEEYRTRRTVPVLIKYSRAQDIAKSLKEVYRELLSSKDKEFEDKDGKRPTGGLKRSYVFEDAVRQHGGEETPVFVDFEGVLSIGVDEVSNMILVSAREEILDSIIETITVLDQAAKPDTTVYVHEVRGIISAARLQKTLAEALGTPWPGGKPLKETAPQAKQGKPASQQKKPSTKRRRGFGSR